MQSTLAKGDTGTKTGRLSNTGQDERSASTWSQSKHKRLFLTDSYNQVTCTPEIQEPYGHAALETIREIRDVRNPPSTQSTTLVKGTKKDQCNRDSTSMSHDPSCGEAASTEGKRTHSTMQENTGVLSSSGLPSQHSSKHDDHIDHVPPSTGIAITRKKSIQSSQAEIKGLQW